MKHFIKLKNDDHEVMITGLKKKRSYQHRLQRKHHHLFFFFYIFLGYRSPSIITAELIFSSCQDRKGQEFHKNEMDLHASKA